MKPNRTSGVKTCLFSNRNAAHTGEASGTRGHKIKRGSHTKAQSREEGVTQNPSWLCAFV
ncbi:MAG: hypothetical protein COA78_32130 [Blastopirellula sp.]|nr:MAG: hypothetical protein COA78_32130 [Blastopirellula sp.]